MSDQFKSQEDAPLFQLFWQNSTLNASRAVQLAERIAADTALPLTVARPRYAAAACPLPKSASKLEPIWRSRASCRHFADGPIEARMLSRLLHPLAARENGSRLLPSAGAKYPLLVYTALLDIKGLDALNGRLAWYDPDAHGLAPIGVCPDWCVLQQVLGVDWTVQPALVVFVVADGDSMLTKYGERGGRFILLEAGGYMAALSLQTAEARLGGITLGSFHDQKMLDLLGLSSPRHSVMFAYACGRPAKQR